MPVRLRSRSSLFGRRLQCRAARLRGHLSRRPRSSIAAVRKLGATCEHTPIGLLSGEDARDIEEDMVASMCCAPVVRAPSSAVWATYAEVTLGVGATASGQGALRLFDATFGTTGGVVGSDRRTPGNGATLRDDAVERYRVRTVEAIRR
jgi:hypothetical protein